MLFEYARVSTAPAAADRRQPGQDQNLNLQLDDLKKAGCQKIFQDRGGGPKVSSAKERPQLRKLLEMLREDDTVIVWKLDGTGRPATGQVFKRTLHADQRLSKQRH